MSTEAVNRSSVVRVESLDDGAIWRVLLNTPKANILDAEKIAALMALFERAAHDTSLKAIVIEGEGPNFSFGASVEEHLPENCAAMLSTFHQLFRTILDTSVITLAAVRGHCLGGGLELAAFCNRVFAAGNARLGQPEIALGVFAPVASLILNERMGRGGAEDLLIAGRSIDAQEAFRLGLVDELHDNPGDAALAYARAHLLHHSASSLRHAVRAARLDFSARFRQQIMVLEHIYNDELMRTSDANEGCRAFLDKRTPAWKNR